MLSIPLSVGAAVAAPFPAPGRGAHSRALAPWVHMHPAFRLSVFAALLALFLVPTPWVLTTTDTGWLPKPGYAMFLVVGAAFVGTFVVLALWPLRTRVPIWLDRIVTIAASLPVAWLFALAVLGSLDPTVVAARLDPRVVAADEAACQQALSLPTLSERRAVFTRLRTPVDSGAVASCALLRDELVAFDADGTCPTLAPTDEDCQCGDARFGPGRATGCTGEVRCVYTVRCEEPGPHCTVTRHDLPG